jgi:cation diffusion facilitator CzcD-associated flavoprotein CzcO
MRRNIAQYADGASLENGVHNLSINGTAKDIADLDVLVVGAGFSGCYLLHYLRKAGFKAKVVEAGADLGGIWHWNTYPGARVDSQYPVYALSIPEVYKTWNWTEQYPGWHELQQYFAHVENCLDLKKDVHFNTKVTSAEWDDKTNRWTVRCDNGTSFRTWIFIAAIGFAAKRHFPDWPGFDSFEGTIHHSSFWPRDLDVSGKKVAVVGTGATGVQIAQDSAKVAGELTVFCRTPNIACPMQQRLVDTYQQAREKSQLAAAFKHRLTTDAGFAYTNRGFPHTHHTAEEREALFEELWNLGGFRMIANSYNDILTDPVANRQ